MTRNVLNILLVIILATFWINTEGQNSGISFTEKNSILKFENSISLSLFAGMNTYYKSKIPYKIKYNEVYYSYYLNRAVGWHSGLSIEASILKILSFEVSPLYCVSRFVYKENEIKEFLSFHYLELPVLLSLNYKWAKLKSGISANFASKMETQLAYVLGLSFQVQKAITLAVHFNKSFNGAGSISYYNDQNDEHDFYENDNFSEYSNFISNLKFSIYLRIYKKNIRVSLIKRKNEKYKYH